MSNKEAKNGMRSVWLPAAMAAPLVQTASASSWPAVLLVGALCLGIGWGLERIHSEPSPWLCVVQWFWLSLLNAEFLSWTMYCWPNYDDYHVVPLTLLSLAAWTAAKGKEHASRAGNVFYWFVIILIGAVLLSGIKDVKLENIEMKAKIKDADLMTVFLLPVIGLSVEKTEKRTKLEILGLGIAASVVTTGVLTLQTAGKAANGFYELSRSLRLLGIGERFESLAAAAMTLGYYVLLTFLLSSCSVGAARIKPGKERWGVWSNAALTALWFLWGFRLSSGILALGTVLTWLVLPVLNSIQINLQKYEKTS